MTQGREVMTGRNTRDKTNLNTMKLYGRSRQYVNNNILTDSQSTSYRAERTQNKRYYKQSLQNNSHEPNIQHLRDDILGRPPTTQRNKTHINKYIKQSKKMKESKGKARPIITS